MRLSHFFIVRPIFAAVVSFFIIIVGLIAYATLPVAQFPEIVPPTVSVSASYPGASAQTVADTVAARRPPLAPIKGRLETPNNTRAIKGIFMVGR